MSIEKTRARIKGTVWQAIAQTGVDLSSIPEDQQQKLVSKIADNVLIELDGILGEIQSTSPVEETADEKDEKILWKGRPFLSMVETYIVTSERLKIVKGMVGRDIENFELIRVQDIDLKQGVTERMLGIGDITIRGQDASKGEVVLRNVSKPEEVYEILRRAWLDARKRHGLQFREFM